jgi:hypothetical protein
MRDIIPRAGYCNESIKHSVLRFDDDEVMNHLEHVYRTIEEWIIDWEKRNGKR